MKANEAPEKIYLLKSQDRILDGWYNKQPIPKTFEQVEYIRTDSFVEKACEFFEENIKEEDCKFGSSEWTELRAEYKSLDSFIRAFVEYMKRE